MTSRITASNPLQGLLWRNIFVFEVAVQTVKGDVGKVPLFQILGPSLVPLFSKTGPFFGPSEGLFEGGTRLVITGCVNIN